MPRWLLVVIFALGCGGSQTARPAGRTTWIEKIKLQGNTAIEDDEVVPHLMLERTRQGGRGVDYYQLAQDTERVRQAYIRKGFFDVKVYSGVVNETGPQHVIFTVVEGPRAKTRVSITGLPAEVPLDKARALVELDENGPFDYETYDLAKEELTKLVESAGYPYAELDAAVTVDEGVAIARYNIEAGPRCTFGEITIVGVPVTGKLHRAIRNRLTFATGDTYSTAKIEKTQDAIYGLGRFSIVNMQPDLQGEATGVRVIPVTITVTHGGRGELRVGVGGAIDQIAPEARIRAGFSHIPRALPLWTFGIDGRFAFVFRQDEDSGDTEYEPRIRVLGTGKRLDVFAVPKLDMDVGVGWDYLALEAYTTTGPISTLGLAYPFTPWLRLQIGWSFAYQFFSNLSEVFDDAARIIYNVDRDRRLASYHQSFIAELRDNPPNPRKGLYIAARVSEGTRIAGGEYGFIQISPDVRAYYPLGPVVGAVHGKLGMILGDVPITERYFAGGASSQRGFPFRELAPRLFRDIDGEVKSIPLGGTASFEVGAELRATVFTVRETPFVASVFLDGADVVADNDNLFKKTLHFAAGAGFGVVLGGFKIRFDVGHRLNRKGPNEPHFDNFDWSYKRFWRVPNTAFHLGIGDAF